MKYFYLLLVFIFSGIVVNAQLLVKDINSATHYWFSGISDVKAAGANTYFVANDGSSGNEPWVTDGTAAGTRMLRDINPGKAFSMGSPDFTYSNGYVYFSADDGTHGFELWRTDGTAAGTIMVKDINTNFTGNMPNGSVPRLFCDVNGVLYFTAMSNAVGIDYAIWKTDGTEAGTVEVNNVYMGDAPNTAQRPSLLTSFNGSLYFVEITDLYRVNSAGVTELIADNIFPAALTVAGNQLYFIGRTFTAGDELWKTDGLTTSLVKDIYPGTGQSNCRLLTNSGGTLFFTADDGTHGTELWKSDGTAAGTLLVKDIWTSSNPNGANIPTNLLDVNGVLYFKSGTSSRFELWKSDGSEAGTMQVIVIAPNTRNNTQIQFINNNGILYFNNNNKELWKSDGTGLGTVLVKTISTCRLLAPVGALPGTIIFYGAEENAANIELWRSDGIGLNTTLLKNIKNDNPGSMYSNTAPNAGYIGAPFAHSNGKLYFGSKNYNNLSNTSLNSTTGNAASTISLNENNPLGSDNPFPTNLVNAGGIIYFGFYDNLTGTELWKSDGTFAGTGIIRDINTGTASSLPVEMYNHNGIIYFTADNGNTGRELWKTDGTYNGTVLVKDIYPGTVGSEPRQFTSFKGSLYFVARNADNGRELWKTDGTAAGTVLVKDIFPGAGSALRATNGGELGNYFTIVGNTLFFTATASAAQGEELWKTDGTEAGTVLVKDINTGAALSSNPRYLTAVGNRLFFVANDLQSGTVINDELWQSDGTATGTVMVKEINPGNSPSNPNNLINLNGILYFSAYEPATGYELWKSNGTATGTVLVKDIEPGVQSGMQPYNANVLIKAEQNNITIANGYLYFSAATAAAGKELWKSNGTAAGTQMTADLFPGTQSSDPERITNANGDIYFVAENGINGKEMFVYKPVEAFVLPPVSANETVNINWQNKALVSGTNQLIVNVQQTGLKPIEGEVHTAVSINPAAIVYNGRTLAKKHFDIEPLWDAANATATVTVYFSQADFNAYNLDDNINGDLPTGPSDVSGKANLRIIQYHGVGTAPGNYSGTEVIINPADENIVWNTADNYWEVSFDVTGFSGFYLSSAVGEALPVTLVSFTGQLTAQSNVLLQWKVEAQKNILSYEIERSSNGNYYNQIEIVTANNFETFTYHFTDENPLNGIGFYRIKIVDADGSVKYSNIISISNKKASLSLYPNPVKDHVYLQINDNTYISSKAVLIDNYGRILQHIFINSSNVKIELNRLPAGIYYIKLDNGLLLKFVK